MKFRVLFTLVSLFIFHNSYSQGYVEYGRTTQANIEMSMNNLGIIGNSFRGVYSSNSWGSCEYPAKSSIEHLFNGGLWIGGIVNGQKNVSTGAVSSSQGYATGASGYEFTAALGAKLIQKSKLLDNQFYDPTATSHQDLIGDFTDKNIIVPGSNNQQITNHLQPLRVDVHFEALNWNFSSANFFVPLTFEITNNGTEAIDSVWIGYWSNFVIRDVSINPPGGTPFYSSGGNAYLDSLQLAYQFDAENIGFNTASYVALKFLGAEDKTGFKNVKSSDFRVNFNTWLFNSGNGFLFGPRNDNEYFNRLSTGLNYNALWNTYQAQIIGKGNRSVLVSAGPFARLQPGEKVKINFAIVCASTVKDGNPSYQNTVQQRSGIIKNALTAQQSFNGEDKNANGILDEGEDLNNDGKITRWIFPEPPAIPNTKIIAEDGKIQILWTDNAVNSIDPVTKKKDFEGFRIYKTQIGFDIQDDKNIENNLKLIASFDKKGNNKFYDNGFDSVRLASPIRFEGDTNTYTYSYTINNITNGWQHAISLTAFDEGNDSLSLASLESSVLQNLRRVFAGKPANNSISSNAPFAYPNPYYGLAAWEGASRFEEDRKLIFSNLPAKCKIKIFNMAGDLIDEIDHDKSYNGSDSKWFNTYSDTKQTVFSGGEHAWDLMSANQQILARGLYLFSVEDLETGKSHSGKFVVVK